MSVFQRMFDSVNKFGVPGIGIPLLADGCKDTKLDINWLKQELSGYDAKSEINLINVHKIKEKVDSFFTPAVLEKIIGRPDSDTARIALSVLSGKGGHWRPLLLSVVYSALSKKENTKILQYLSVSIECFHKASLVHDDIQDLDLYRNGEASLYSKYGTGVAINIGDYLIGMGYLMLSKSGITGNAYADMMRIVSEGHTRITKGQGEELLAVANRKIVDSQYIFSIFENKTSAAFEVALLMGAIAAKADKAIIDQLQRFGQSIGIAYQIKDDLNDYSGDQSDILKRNFSVLFSLLYERISESDELVLKNALSEHDFHTVKNFIKKYEVVSYTSSLLQEQLSEARTSLRTIPVVELKIVLYEIIGQIFKEYT